MTSIPVPPAKSSEGIRLLLKRAGHELRNAQNAAAVNMEVVRSRIAAGKTDREALESFAKNAAKGLEESTRIGEALVSLFGAAASAMTNGTFNETAEKSGMISLELGMASDQSAILVERIHALAESAGFSAEAAPAGVILRIPPDNERNRA